MFNGDPAKVFYHITPSKNKDSILEYGLRPTLLPHVYLAANFYDAFLLAPATQEYCFLYNSFSKVLGSDFAFLYDWSNAHIYISLFTISPQKLNIRQQEQRDINFFEHWLDIPCNDTNRTLYEYTTNHVPAKNIVSVKDYALAYPVIVSTNELLSRHEEYTQLLRQCTRQEAISIMTSKYVPCSKMFIPNNNKS